MPHFTFQGTPAKTKAERLADFLRERGLEPARTLCELNGQALAPGADAPLAEGDTLNAFSIVAGG